MSIDDQDYPKIKAEFDRLEAIKRENGRYADNLVLVISVGIIGYSVNAFNKAGLLPEQRELLFFAVLCCGAAMLFHFFGYQFAIKQVQAIIDKLNRPISFESYQKSIREVDFMVRQVCVGKLIRCSDVLSYIFIVLSVLMLLIFLWVVYI